MTTLTINPSASNHDAWETGSGVVDLTGEVKITAGTVWGGLLLPGVTVPVGATINSATLYYQASATSHDDPGILWYGNDVDNAAVFTTGTNNIENRVQTTASVSDTATGIGNTTYRAITITSIIAEVCGRGGWASGNNIALIADAQASADLWIRSYDSGGAVWYVEIDYTSGTDAAAAMTQGGQTVSAAAAVGIHAASAPTQDGQTVSAAGALLIELVPTGYPPPDYWGDPGYWYQAGNTVSAAATVATHAEAAIAQAGDTSSGAIATGRNGRRHSGRRGHDAGRASGKRGHWRGANGRRGHDTGRASGKRRGGCGAGLDAGRGSGRGYHDRRRIDRRPP